MRRLRRLVRTLTDVAAESDPALAIEATRDALSQGLTTPDQIAASLAGRPDAARLGDLQANANVTIPR